MPARRGPSICCSTSMTAARRLASSPSTSRTIGATCCRWISRSRTDRRLPADERFQLLHQKVEQVAFGQRRRVADGPLRFDHTAAAAAGRVADDARLVFARVEQYLDGVFGGPVRHQLDAPRRREYGERIAFGAQD